MSPGEVFGILKCLWAPAAAAFDHVFQWEDNKETLALEMLLLKWKSEDVENKVGKAKKQGQKEWLVRVNILGGKIKKTLRDCPNEEGSGICGGISLNFCKRCCLNPQALKLLKEAQDLNKNGDEFMRSDVANESSRGTAAESSRDHDMVLNSKGDVFVSGVPKNFPATEMDQVADILKSGQIMVIFDYVFNWKEKIETLKKEMGDLERKWEDVKAKVEIIRKQGGKPSKQVEGWIDDVKSLVEKIKKWEDCLEKKGFGTDGGKSPNVLESYQLSEQAMKDLEAAQDLHRKGDQFTNGEAALDAEGSSGSEDAGLDLGTENIRKGNALSERGQVSTSSHRMLSFSEFSYSELQQATLNFDELVKIDEGGNYGGVYKGFLRHTDVVIKMLNPQCLKGKAEFHQEVDVLSKLRHPNLVTLIGACPEAWALVYEFVPNGSLEDHLTCKGGTPPLSWQVRTRIANEICSALVFLHSHEPEIVVHGDLKPANILLDANCGSKLGDFGICRLLAQTNTTSTIFLRTQPEGTKFYVDPVFLITQELSTLSDIYSFGVILLRILTGRPAKGIAKEVGAAIEKGSLQKILDTSAGNWPVEESHQLVELALRCCDLERKNRPDLAGEAWKVLERMMKAATGTHRIVNFSVFSYLELQQATLNFDESLKIGEGGYGVVYKSFLRDTTVAIKKLTPQSIQGIAVFQQEVDVLSRVRHPNLVTLIGACPEALAIVYEFIPNGSLEDHLTCNNGMPPLFWQVRARIACEICSALVFLHSHQPESVVHGDLKPANILLDANCESKLGDFGIYRMYARSNTLSTIFHRAQPKGTFFYVDPVFLTTGELTKHSDVYSFGIVLLQLLTGKSARGIAKEVQAAMEKGSLHKILDASAGNWPVKESHQVAKLALRCCDVVRKNRPDLQGEVWKVLEQMMKTALSMG